MVHLVRHPLGTAGLRRVLWWLICATPNALSYGWLVARSRSSMCFEYCAPFVHDCAEIGAAIFVRWPFLKCGH